MKKAFALQCVNEITAGMTRSASYDRLRLLAWLRSGINDVQTINLEADMPDAKTISEAIAEHCKTLSNRDKEGWLSLWADDVVLEDPVGVDRSEEHTSELKSLMRNSYAGFRLKKKNKTTTQKHKSK